MIFLAPKSGQTGDNLLFSAHDLRQEHLVLFWCHTKCLADYIIVTNVENVRAFHQYVRQHKDDQGDIFLLGDCFHLSKQFFLPAQHSQSLPRSSQHPGYNDQSHRSDPYANPPAYLFAIRKSSNIFYVNHSIYQTS